jgi:uncharacterized protein (UPF0332 family)
MAAQSFDWSKYHDLANELSKRHDEASLRSALSRAYYYVYHIALERAEANSFTVRAGEGSHTQLWRVFSGSPVAECQKLAEIASRLKQKRERADYNQRYVRIEEDIPEMLDEVGQFAVKLKQLDHRLPNPASQRK